VGVGANYVEATVYVFVVAVTGPVRAYIGTRAPEARAVRAGITAAGRGGVGLVDQGIGGGGRAIRFELVTRKTLTHVGKRPSRRSAGSRANANSNTTTCAPSRLGASCRPTSGGWRRLLSVPRRCSVGHVGEV
jgi:hypothetical protein